MSPQGGANVFIWYATATSGRAEPDHALARTDIPRRSIAGQQFDKPRSVALCHRKSLVGKGSSCSFPTAAAWIVGRWRLTSLCFDEQIIIMPNGTKPMIRLTAIFAVALALLLGGCAQRYRPIDNVDRAMPPVVESLSPDRTRDVIITAGRQLDWIMTPISPGHLEATQRTPKFSATADIYYTPVRLQILLRSSVNLFQTPTTIHAHYNLWVRNLEKSIITDLSHAVVAAANR
jgi:hypothetical protein